ncbi:MAG: ATP-dependent helicase [bacterium]
MSDPILDPLNEQQVRAVKHGQGPLLILAGAGSGKTRAITHRMAYLIRDRDVPPYKILGVTFTNKAADEMMERTRQLVGRERLQPELSTFHSFGVQFLRKEISALDRDRNFTIYDDNDQKSLVKTCMEELNIDSDSLKPRAVVNRISRAKDQLKSPEDYGLQEHAEPDVAQIYERYQEHLEENNAYDFGDLICEPVYLLRRNETVRTRWQDKFEHMLVDEFQDTNPAQYEFAQLLSDRHRNIAVVGDDDQSIYSWRGADVTNIMNFEQDFPETKTIRLEQNYRSTQPILEAAHNIIENNSTRKEKELWTNKEEGPEPTVYEAHSDYDEAEYVLETIEMLDRMRGISPGNCAIFFRTNAQTRVFEEVFMREGMPYVIVSGVGFYERKEIKDLMAYLKVLVNPADDQAVERVINTPTRGIGKKTFGTLRELASDLDVSLIEALSELENYPSISSRAQTALGKFKSLYDSLLEHRDEDPLSVIEAILEKTKYIENEVEKEEDTVAESRKENIDELKRVADNFVQERPDPTLAEFVEEISLINDVDTFEEQTDRVNIMTLHAAKGLEFDAVFMAGMEEGLLPHSNSEYDQERLEEERRLCYVGFTRARERLYCTFSERRFMWGSQQYNDPSRFLKEAGLFEESTATSSDPFSRPDSGSSSRESSPVSTVSNGGGESSSSRNEAEPVKYSPGDTVKHQRFGEGEVIEVTGSDSSLTVKVNFDSVGIKQLALSFATLEKV